ILWPLCPMQATTQSIYQASTVVLNMESSGSATSHFFGTTLPYWPRLTHSNSSLALFTELGERETPSPRNRPQSRRGRDPRSGRLRSLESFSRGLSCPERSSGKG